MEHHIGHTTGVTGWSNIHKMIEDPIDFNRGRTVYKRVTVRMQRYGSGRYGTRQASRLTLT